MKGHMNMMGPGEREVQPPGVVDTSPSALLNHLVVADLRKRVQGQDHQSVAWFVPNEPGVVAGNLGVLFVYIMLLLFVSLVLPVKAGRWLWRRWEGWWQTEAWRRRESDRLIEDSMLQCMGVLAASRLSGERGAVSLSERDGDRLLNSILEGRSRGWTWRASHQGLSMSLEVHDEHSHGGFVKTRMRLRLSHQDGAPVRVPVEWPSSLRVAPDWDGEALTLEIHSSLEERLAAIERRQRPHVGDAAATLRGDASVQVAEVVGAVLHANGLFAGDADREAEAPTVLLEQAVSADSSAEIAGRGFEEISSRSVLREPSRVVSSGWWRALKGMKPHWGKSFMQTMGLTTGAALFLTSAYLLLAFAGLWTDTPVMLVVAMLLMSFVSLWSWFNTLSLVSPQWRRRAVRVRSPRRELTLDRGVLALGEATRVDLSRPWSTQLSRSPALSAAEADGGQRWLNVVLTQPLQSGEEMQQLRFRVLADDSAAWRALPELELAAPEVSADDFVKWVWPVLGRAALMHGAAQPLQASHGRAARRAVKEPVHSTTQGADLENEGALDQRGVAHGVLRHGDLEDEREVIEAVAVGVSVGREQ